MNNADRPSFPGSYKGATQGIEIIDFVPGLTKRELIAAIIMAKSTPTNDALEVLSLTRIAIFSADALLQQLEITKPKP